MKKRLFLVVLALVVLIGALTLTAFAKYEEPEVWEVGPAEIHSYEPNTGYMSAELILSQEKWPSSADCYRDVLTNPAVYDECLESDWGTVSFTVTLDTPILMEWEIDPATGKATKAGNEAIALWYRDYVWSCIDAVLLDHPERPDLRYETAYVGVSGTQETNGDTAVFTVHQIAVDYIDIVTADYDEAVFKAAVERAKTALNDDDGPYDVDAAGKSIYEKLDAFNDYLCNNVTYDQDSDWKYHQTAYTPLVDGWSVCAGYSASFKLFCDIYGIPCMVVNGYSEYVADSQRHAWNYVEIDENRYAVDVTWNDSDDRSDDQSTDLYTLVGSETVISGKKFGESHLPVNRYLPHPALSADAYAYSIEGTCGEDITWTLNREGLLKLSGTGEMYDLENSASAPWMGYMQRIRDIEVSEGITRISSFAFFGAANLESVTLPESLTAIGGMVFEGCNKLGRVYYGGCKEQWDYLVADSIGSYNDPLLEAELICAKVASDLSASGTFGDSITWTLKNCVLTVSGTGSIPDGAEGTVPWAHYRPVIFSVVIKKGVTGIGDHAFLGCRNMTEISIPDSLARFGDFAFRDCLSLTSIRIPDGTTVIGGYAFQNCVSLKTVTIPTSVANISSGAFSGCAGLTTVSLPENDYIYLDKGAFSGCIGLGSFHIPSGAVLGDSVFSGCVGVTEFTVDAANPNYSAVNGILFTKDGTELIQYPAGKKDTAYSVPTGVTNIWAGAFSGNAYVKSAVVPKGMTQINGAVFRDCTALASVSLPTGITKIGANAFSGCRSLVDVAIPDSVTFIDDQAFSNCASLTCIVIPKGITILGYEMFRGCTALNSVEIPETVTVIGDSVFEDCTSLTGIELPNDLTALGNSAFLGCTALESIEIPNGVTVIENAAFYECTNLTSVELPDGLEEIGASAFYECTSLTKIDIPKGVERIGECAFYFCLEMSTVNFHGDVPLFGNNAFFWVEAAAGYPCGNATWTDAVRQNYGGALTWKINHSFKNNVCTDCGTKGITIAVQPEDQSALDGYVYFAVEAKGEGLIYQWQVRAANGKTWNKTSLKGYNTDTLRVPVNANNDGRHYRCVITDKYGNVLNSEEATLTLSKPVAIVTQPKSVVAASGEKATVKVTASGDGLTYKWYYKDTVNKKFYLTTSFTGNTYSVTMNDARNGRKVYCVISDKYGNSVTTETVTLTMGNTVKIVTQPTNVSVAKGKVAKVTVKATGDGLTYKWYYKNAGASKFTLTDSFKSNYYQVSMSAARNGRQVYCVITDKYGNSVTTNTVTLSMGTPLKIVTQPESVTVKNGETAKVTVKASGDGLTYKWYYKNAGASKFSYTSSFTGSSYSVKMSSTRSGRQVYCVISDKYGNSVTTDIVTLTMANPVKIVTQPTDVTVAKGKVAKVTVQATGDGLTYQWYYKNAGASKFSLTDSFKGNSYSVSMSAARSGRQVYCVITDKYGNSVTTDTVTLTMANPVKIVTQPTDVTVAKGKVAKVTVQASGDGLTYQWYYKNAGASKFTLTDTFKSNYYQVSMTAARSGRQVYCVITDKYGNSVTTNTVTLRMK